MNISYNWLKEYIDFELTPLELAEQLTAAGLETNLVQQFPDYFQSIKVGYVISRETHPNADKLSVCQVDLGTGEPQQIICGAPNVAAGQKVPVATLGTTFPGGMKIKKAKLRGVISNGMICSERELELSDDHAGIMVLDEDATPGSAMGSYLSGNDVTLELDLTPDRPDALGHIGVARDLAALLGKELKVPAVKLVEAAAATAAEITVEIQDVEACPRYAARLVKDIKIADSPAWLRRRLQAVGIRSINNVVDAANYVLMETGHPLHTFDLSYIEGQKIVVRRAEPKEKITTLDGKERELDDQVLLICDTRKPVAVAGIMGGENSEVKVDTTELLLESAYFDPVVIRRGARKLQLATDASHRFERGADPNGIPYALDRLAALIIELAGGYLTQGQVDVYPQRIEPLQIILRASRCNQLLGTDIPADLMRAILSGLGMIVQEERSGELMVTVPTFRPDITREIDLVEEIARIYGYDNIPIPEHFSIANQLSKPSPDKVREQIMDYLAAIGFNQIYGNSLVAIDEHPIVLGDEEPMILANALTRDMASIRTSLLPGVSKIAGYNLNRRQVNLKLFEVGQVSSLDSSIDTGAREMSHLALFVSGDYQIKQWSQPAVPADIFQLKGIISALFAGLFKQSIQYVATEHEQIDSALEIRYKGQQIGVIGEPRGRWAEQAEGAYAELRIPTATQLDPVVKYEQVAVFPRVERDLSILVDTNISYSDLEHIIVKNSGKYLIYSQLYDIYEGKSIASGKKSLTFRLVFQNQKRTLTEKEIDRDFQRILKGLEDANKATLREAT